MHITQPAATKILMDIEEILEARLFERLSRGMRPLDDGRTWLAAGMVAASCTVGSKPRAYSISSGTPSASGSASMGPQHRRRSFGTTGKTDPGRYPE